MRKSKIIIKPATIVDVKEFYGGRHTKSFRGIAAVLDGKVVGIAGISFDTCAMVLFSDIKKEMRSFKRDIVKVIPLLDKMVKGVGYPVAAVANKKEPLAERLLIKLGFISSGRFTLDGSKIFWRFP